MLTNLTGALNPGENGSKEYEYDKNGNIIREIIFKIKSGKRTPNRDDRNWDHLLLSIILDTGFRMLDTCRLKNEMDIFFLNT